MYVKPAAATHDYRVTRRGTRQPQVLAGMGSYQGPGGRYNGPHQRTVYASDDPLVPITEAAFYQALMWQEKIGGGPAPTTFLLPTVPAPTYPFESTHTLWCFTLDDPPNLIDLDDPAAYLAFRHRPHQILNTSQFYETTKTIANLVRGHVHPLHPVAQGLKAPAVRTPVRGGFQPYQYAFFVFGRKLAGRIPWRADLILEFLNDSGRQIDPTTRAIDWARPRFQLNAFAHPIPAFAARPGAQPYAEAQWYDLMIQFI